VAAVLAGSTLALPSFDAVWRSQILFPPVFASAPIAAPSLGIRCRSVPRAHLLFAHSAKYGAIRAD